jgi:hypothetical protein
MNITFPKTENLDLFEFELHRPSIKGTKLLSQVIKEVIITCVKLRKHKTQYIMLYGSSLNRPGLAAIFFAFRGTPVTKPMPYLCENQALLKAVKRWVREGGKAT